MMNRTINTNNINFTNNYSSVNNVDKYSGNNHLNSMNNNILRNQSINKDVETKYRMASINRERETKMHSNFNLNHDSNINTKTHSTPYASYTKKLDNPIQPLKPTHEINRNASVSRKSIPNPQQEDKFIICHHCKYPNYSSKVKCEKCESIIDPSRNETRSNYDNYVNKSTIPLNSSLNKILTKNLENPHNNNIKPNLSNRSSSNISSLHSNKMKNINNINTSKTGSNLTNNTRKLEEWICIYCKGFNRNLGEFCDHCHRGNTPFSGQSNNETSTFKQKNCVTSSNKFPTSSNQILNGNFRPGSNLPNTLSNYESKTSLTSAVKLNPTHISHAYNQNTNSSSNFNDMRRTNNLGINNQRASNGMYSNQSNISLNSSSSIRYSSLDKNHLTRSFRK
jgi:hypothetical protein